MIAFLVAWTLLFAPACTDERPSDPPAVSSKSVVNDDTTSRRLFSDVMARARAENLYQRPIGEIMQEVGVQFLGKPYVAGLLDAGNSEQLVCRLDGFDCVTFYESVLNMARGIQAQDYSWATFQRNMTDTRYRGGVLSGYCSRMHYFTDWIFDNEERGNVEHLSRDLGGVLLDREIDFMTSHRDQYRQLSDGDNFSCIQDIEQELTDLEIFYVPETEVRALYPKLRAGDIVGTTTRIEGLDVTHTGLVYDDGKGGRGFLHASPGGGIKISPDLEKYLLGNKNQIGLMIVRPLENRP